MGGMGAWEGMGMGMNMMGGMGGMGGGGEAPGAKRPRQN